MRNVSDEICKGNQNTLYVLVTLFPENRAIHDIIWDAVVDPDRPHDKRFAWLAG